MASPQMQSQNVRIIKSQDYRSRYANHTQLISVGTEIRFMFGEVEPFLEGAGSGVMMVSQEGKVETHTSITIPVLLAKEIHRMLGDQLELLEKQQAVARTRIERS